MFIHHCLYMPMYSCADLCHVTCVDKYAHTLPPNAPHVQYKCPKCEVRPLDIMGTIPNCCLSSRFDMCAHYIRVVYIGISVVQTVVWCVQTVVWCGQTEFLHLQEESVFLPENGGILSGHIRLSSRCGTRAYP